MLDFLACQSAEKLVLDAEAIGMARRLLAGIEVRTETLATVFYEAFSFKGAFLRHKLTRDLFQSEQYLPSSVIDRDSIRGWQQNGSLDAFARACTRTGELLAAYQRPAMLAEHEHELHAMVASLANRAGMDQLPVLE